MGSEMKCKCGKGTFVYPNKWWKEVLKLMRCDWCGETARGST